MKKQFNHIFDLNGKDKVYPIDKNFYTLFFTEDRRFFIYALYTKKDFSSPQLIEIDFDSYMNLRADDVIENFATDINNIANILLYAKRQAVLENLSISQILNLDKD